MKQINHFNNYSFALPKITDWYFHSADIAGNVDMRLFWEAMGSMVLEFGLCRSTSNTMPAMAEKYWSQVGNIPYSQVSSINNPVGGFAANIYYVRSYVRNIAGIVWSNVVIVNTVNTTRNIPSVTTSTGNYWITRAQYGGEVTNDGGEAVTDKGVCWNLTGTPTKANNLTHDGVGTGIFYSDLFGLTPGTTYYMRAYATNSIGTNYGAQISFTTNAAGVPITLIDNLQKTTTYSNVNVWGSILDNGGAAITQRGFCWNLSGNPTLNDHVTYASGSGDSDFSATVSGLPGLTTVHVRVFAINSYGIGLGGTWTFDTDAAPSGTVVFSLSTVSTNSAWTATQINKSGAVLHWEVSGAVTASADGYAPTFNLSTPGTKYIVVTSTDGATGISFLNFYGCGITDFNASGCPYITFLSVANNLLTSISVSNNTALTSLALESNNLTSIDISQNQYLSTLWIRYNQLSSLNIGNTPSITQVYADGNVLTSISISGNNALTVLFLSSNKLSVSIINSLLDTLIAYNNQAGNTLHVGSQNPPITPNAAKVAALDAIWTNVVI